MEKKFQIIQSMEVLHKSKKILSIYAEFLYCRKS